MRSKAQIGRTVCLTAWLVFLFYLYRLCRFGGVRNYIVPLTVGGLITIVSAVFWLFFHIRAEKKGEPEGIRMFLWTELLIFLIGSFYFGGQIVYAAIPYHGALSWKLDEWTRKKEIVLEHDNFLTDGVEGVLSDLDEKYRLPDELYISNEFQMTFDGDGQIQTIYTFLYGENEKGETETFLVDYDRTKSEKMTVWTDGQASDTYDSGMKLEPMLTILQAADYEEQIERWKEQFPDEVYEILYYGYQSFSSADGLEYLPGDVDGDGEEKNGNALALLQAGGEVAGYEVSLHIKEMDDGVTPVRYIMEPEYTSAESISQKQEESQIEEAKGADAWSVDQTDGTMYFFLAESEGWRLKVIDAAAGSRFYVLEKTEDGGDTWTVWCENPFEGSGGVANGLLFFDQEFGFASLSGASQSYASLYVTRDGGKTFTRLQMPTDTVTELPDIAADLGYTAEDYDYLSMPQLQDGILTVVALTGAGETEGILYQSEDNGETWKWTGVQ